jgi:hypothetical protein
MIIARLYGEIENADACRADWKSRIEAKLYKKGEKVSFAAGAADSPYMVSGTLVGIGECGELIIVPNGETAERYFTAGELIFNVPRFPE